MPKSAFLREQGNTPINRVWDFLIVYSEYDYSMKDIAKHSKVGYTTLKRIFKEFKKKKFVIQTRTVGRAKMYQLNRDNPVVESFINFFWTVVRSVVERDHKEKVDIGSGQSIGVPVSATSF